jgi:hypothetical protein
MTQIEEGFLKLTPHRLKALQTAETVDKVSISKLYRAGNRIYLSRFVFTQF